jgi:hypothetical protein
MLFDLGIGLVRFQVLMAASMKMTAIWDIALWCSCVEIVYHFRGAYCLRYQGPDDGTTKYL